MSDHSYSTVQTLTLDALETRSSLGAIHHLYGTRKPGSLLVLAARLLDIADDHAIQQSRNVPSDYSVARPLLSLISLS